MSNNNEVRLALDAIKVAVAEQNGAASLSQVLQKLAAFMPRLSRQSPPQRGSDDDSTNSPRRS